MVLRWLLCGPGRAENWLFHLYVDFPFLYIPVWSSEELRTSEPPSLRCFHRCKTAVRALGLVHASNNYREEIYQRPSIDNAPSSETVSRDFRVEGIHLSGGKGKTVKSLTLPSAIKYMKLHFPEFLIIIDFFRKKEMLRNKEDKRGGENWKPTWASRCHFEKKKERRMK